MGESKTKPKAETISLTTVLMGLEDGAIIGRDRDGIEIDLTVQMAINRALTVGMDVLSELGKARGPVVPESEKSAAGALAFHLKGLPKSQTGYGFTPEQKTLIRKCSDAGNNTLVHCALMRIIDPETAEKQEKNL